MSYKLKYTGLQVDDSVGGFHAETLYDDIDFEGITLATGNSAPDLINFYGQGNIIGRSFDGGSTLEQLYGGGELLHFYKENGDVSFHVHWMPSTATAGTVKWFLEYTWYNMESLPQQPIVNTISVLDQAGGVAWFPRVVAFPDISGQGKKTGSHFRFRIYRNPSDVEDTYPNDAAFDSAGLHVPVDSNGSRQIFIK